MATRAATSTIDIDPGIDASRRGARLRIVFLVVVVAIMLLAVTGWFGVRTRTITTVGHHYRTRVEYTAISRRGLTSPITITITAPQASFDGDVTVALPSSYLGRFDVRRVEPDPDATTTNGDTVLWTFDSPPGRVFVIDVDSGIDPGARPWWAKARIGVRVASSSIADVDFRTWIWP